MSGNVERIEPWQLAGYLAQLREGGATEVGWNKERLALEAAIERAEALTETATVVTDGAQVYVAEPDHSADDPPRVNPVPLQIWPRKI
jgi:hypothetical protein